MKFVRLSYTDFGRIMWSDVSTYEYGIDDYPHVSDDTAETAANYSTSDPDVITSQQGIVHLEESGYLWFPLDLVHRSLKSGRITDVKFVIVNNIPAVLTTNGSTWQGHIFPLIGNLTVLQNPPGIHALKTESIHKALDYKIHVASNPILSHMINDMNKEFNNL